MFERAWLLSTDRPVILENVSRDARNVLQREEHWTIVILRTSFTGDQ